MRLGFDLDSTLIGWLIDPVRQAAIDLGIKEYPNEWDYNYPNLSEKHRNRVYELFSDSDFMGPQNVVFDLKDKHALEYWKSKGHKLHLMTLRVPEVAGATNMIINQYFSGLFDKVFICHRTANRVKHLIDERIDVWVGDSPKGIETSMDLGIRTFLIYNRKTCFYNKESLMEYIGHKNFRYARAIYDIWKGRMI